MTNLPRLTVNIAPSIHDCPAFVTVNHGDKLRLTPTVYGHPAPTNTWTHHYLLVTSNSSLLTVTESAGPADSGVYSLRASNEVGDAFCKTVVRIGSFLTF